MVQDIRYLEFEDNSFDLIVDKGTLDAILCGDDSAINSALALKEMCRVLKSGGKLLIFTYGKPESRLCYLKKDDYDWDVNYEIIDGSRFLYIMNKR